MKKLLLSLSILLCFLTLFAHEFWLAPNKYQFKVGDTALIHFNVGENFKGENWSGDSSGIASLFYYNEDGEKDVSGLIKGKGDSLALSITCPGTQMVTYCSNPALIKLSADSFNTYLKEKGLREILKYRKNNNEMQQTATEKYVRCAKTLFQVGGNYTNQCLRQTDLSLDIVPLQNPYDIRSLDKYVSGNDLRVALRIAVYYKREPLKNALVTFWRLQQNGEVEQHHERTNEHGEASITMTLPGEFLVSCVHMERNTSDSSAQWQSYWGSLTFGQKGNFFVKRRVKQQ